MSENKRLTINYNVVRLHIYGVVGLLITKLRKVCCWVFCLWIFFELVNIWQSYKQERCFLVHFLRLLAMCWPGAQSARDTLCATPPRLKYVGTLPCNLSFIASFLTLMFHKVVCNICKVYGRIFNKHFSVILAGNLPVKKIPKIG